MNFSITVLLICMISSKVLSLTCQNCISFGITPCTSTQINCPDLCASSTISVFTSVNVTNLSIQTCGPASSCASGSLNLGSVNTAFNINCCSTDLCNNNTVPAPPQGSPNGKLCYICDTNGCSGTVNCVGDQNFCLSASVFQGNNTLSRKGCITKSLCNTAGLTSFLGSSLVDVQCCEGNLCNSAESFILSFLLIIVPLLCTNLFCVH